MHGVFFFFARNITPCAPQSLCHCCCMQCPYAANDAAAPHVVLLQLLLKHSNKRSFVLCGKIMQIVIFRLQPRQSWSVFAARLSLKQALQNALHQIGRFEWTAPRFVSKQARDGRHLQHCTKYLCHCSVIFVFIAQYNVDDFCIRGSSKSRSIYVGKRIRLEIVFRVFVANMVYILIQLTMAAGFIFSICVMWDTSWSPLAKFHQWLT